MSDMQTSRPGAPSEQTNDWWMPSSQQPSSPPPPPPPAASPGGAPYGGAPYGGAPYGGPSGGAPHGGAPYGGGPYGGPPQGPPGWQPDYTSPLPQAPLPPSRRSSTWRNRFLAGLVLVAVAVGGGVTGAALNGGSTTVTSAASSPLTGGGTTATQPLAKVAAAVQPSVVSIQVTGSGESGEGSGVILRSDGTILTNNHVAAVAGNGGSIKVRFADGKTASARTLGRDPSTDLAVIKAEGVSGLTPATLGSSNGLHVGDTVLALGSPLGLEGSVSSGIVSALHRTVDLGSESQGGGGSGTSPFGQGNSSSSPATPTVVTDAIQTDAAINPGNSGGPLVDDTGRVVGLNTAIASLGSSGGASTQSGNIGVGFAIPIDQAKTVADQLINGQAPSHAQLGISVSDATSGGAQVGEVTGSSGAAKAGLQTGDVVVQADSAPVADADALIAAVRSHKPGDTITLTYTRNGARRTAQVTLGSSS
ncbi:MAG TPA: trypsin-like peptidase domain-containing protein [Frankiaceae bacterium]|nr:trypsin-like peptidase domain-containing protein [Frankiaceae bacterium]